MPSAYGNIITTLLPATTIKNSRQNNSKNKNNAKKANQEKK